VKKINDNKKLTLRQEVIRTLTSAELKTVIGAAGTCNSNTSSVRTRELGVTTC
jgi:hypothetical protein